MDSLQIFGRDGQRCLLHFSEFTSLPVSFPYTCHGLTSEALQWNGAAPPPLLITLSIEEKWITEGGDGLLRRQLHLKRKSVITKINNQTNNQTTICSNFKDELLLGALCSFCDFWCHNVFLTLWVFFFVFPWLTPPLSLISMALWLQAAHLRVEKNSLAMYKKEQVKPKMLFLMSFLYCSLVSFFVTVIIWWRFPNCTKLHGN